MIKKYLLEYNILSQNVIEGIGLVSAKTGYNIEDLITRLMKVWRRKGDVYVVGCTNVGKSTLFNTLLLSDYCKETAREYINRATISNWPGTTLNTLKFPIINPAHWRLEERKRRLKEYHVRKVEEKNRLDTMKRPSRNIKNTTLMGEIGLSLQSPKEKALTEMPFDHFTEANYTFDCDTGEIQPLQSKYLEHKKEKLKNELHKYDEDTYKQSYWCYDTPGFVNPQQMINLLTQKELTVMLTKRLIQPRSYSITPGETMFVSGLGRIDYIQGVKSMYFTAVCATNLPIYIMKTREADAFYDQHIGTEHLKVPMGEEDRLNKLPALVGREFNMNGTSWKECTADILLSSLGNI